MNLKEDQQKDAYRRVFLAAEQKVKQPGLAVRSNLCAGAWQCTSCQGEVMGDQLFRPTCSYCRIV